MALSRRTGQRFQASIWPGFVDAMTGLLLVLFFVLSIFMVVQFTLRETITGQESELDDLAGEVAALAQALGLQERRGNELQAWVGELSATLDDAQARVAALTAERDRAAMDLGEAQTRITAFEAQVAALIADRDRAMEEVTDLAGERERLLSEQEALNLALAQARNEIDAGAEAARLAAARREALEALVADLRTKNADQTEQAAALASDLEAAREALTEEEAARLAEAAAAQALRERLETADAELTAMTLALEAQRKDAEETLTLLAAARAERRRLDAQLTEAEAAQREAEARAAENMSEAERRAALLAAARQALASEEAVSSQAQRQTELLNQQVAALRTQLGELQSLLDAAREADAAKDVRLESLGAELNTALARVAAEERRRRQLEEAERARLEAEAEALAAEARALEEESRGLEAEARDLLKYRSEFFGRLRDLLGGQEGVRIVGDRFVFSSEVLFAPASAELSPEGRGEIAKIADILNRIRDEIPPEIDWVLQVDGHTDDTPLSGTGQYADNWELSQARALSVVRYMSQELGIPPQRLSANGFGEFQPVNTADTDEARAQNRRIEIKFTGK